MLYHTKNNEGNILKHQIYPWIMSSRSTPMLNFSEFPLKIEKLLCTSGYVTVAEKTWINWV